MYGVDPALRVRVATTQMVDAATLWLQSVESQLESVSWEQFCIMVRDRFDRDQHELLVRQLLHIRQTSSVSDYISFHFFDRSAHFLQQGCRLCLFHYSLH
jgi:hypothetical protein